MAIIQNTGGVVIDHTVQPVMPVNTAIHGNVIAGGRIIDGSTTRIARRTAGPLIPDGAIVYDDFNRPDGPLGTAPTGQAWIHPYHNPPISTIVSGAVALNSGSIRIDAGARDIDVTWTVNGGFGAMFVFGLPTPDHGSPGQFYCWQDGPGMMGSNFFFPVIVFGTTLAFHVGSASFPQPITPATVRIVIKGADYLVTVNDAPIYSGTYVYAADQLPHTGTYIGVSDDDVYGMTIESVAVRAAS